ncbi:MAG: hypothetical protein KF814_01755 [Nitrospiraceae bacterium]|nr:hypothetical protein [Nitrospiraceae bacterium]
MAKLLRIVIQLPEDLKTRLDELKQRGYTTSGFIRAVLERELQKPEYRPVNGHSQTNGEGREAGKPQGKHQGKARL